MTYKTLKDCICCNVVSICDAHVIDGKWKHRLGVSPCDVNKGSEHASEPPTS
jgi:hypothetical protein